MAESLHEMEQNEEPSIVKSVSDSFLKMSKSGRLFVIEMRRSKELTLRPLTSIINSIEGYIPLIELRKSPLKKSEPFHRHRTSSSYLCQVFQKNSKFDQNPIQVYEWRISKFF